MDAALFEIEAADFIDVAEINNIIFITDSQDSFIPYETIEDESKQEEKICDDEITKC